MPNTQIYYRFYLGEYTPSTGDFNIVDPIWCFAHDDENKITAISSTGMTIQYRLWALGSYFRAFVWNTYTLTDCYLFKII